MTATATPRALLVELGETTVDDWYRVAASLAEGIVCANFYLLRASGQSFDVRAYRHEHRAPLPTQSGWTWPVRLVNAVMRDGGGNCLELACAMAAQYRLEGEFADVALTPAVDGHTAHAVVRVGDKVLDPERLANASKRD